MNRKWAQEKEVDRTGWEPGPWDDEPDYYEWTTSVGYPAFMMRIDSGAWAGIVEAPHPTDGMMLLAFSHHMRDTYRSQHQAGMISKTDIEGMGQFCFSMEHYASPGPAYGGRTWNRGPYKTMNETIKICEEEAQHIYDTNKDKAYVDYFTRRWPKTE
jgi:hypothetical protein